MRSPITPPRRRLGVDERRQELLRACLELIGQRRWDEISMSDIAAAAGASKPLIYHYFATKNQLYLAAVRAAAAELRTATTSPAPTVPPRLALQQALTAHVEWVEANSGAYRAILQGGVSPDIDLQAIIEESRADVVSRLAHGFALSSPTAAQRIVLRGWVGFLEGACLDWLEAKDISKAQLVRILAASLRPVVPAADA